MQLNKFSKIYAITPNTNLNFKKIKQVLIKHKIKILQYRNKTKNFNSKLKNAYKLKQLCSNLGVILIINDDINLCKKINADGVHLGKDDINFIKAKRALPNKIIGVSCYNNLILAEKYQNLGVNYVAFGAIFPSITKPNAIKCDISILTTAQQKLNIPIVAIGGINFYNKNNVLDSGADSVAMISALWY